ncbi:MAG: bifunctional diaminohydroxyphosphoribosylaminopyrimidine deaminase/5-amino-6-(5-phosphoribosylamino)uracil reductase RibD [Armatimonadota bacterium]
MTDISIDRAWMRMALRIAGKGRPHPNPPVGAVVVHNKTLIGRGWHNGPGSPHAEQMALDACIGRAVGATLYVTLEPCCHTVGRDGCPRVPCWQRCTNAGISRIVVACEDIDPRTAGKGIQQLRDQGIHVDVGLLRDVALHQQRGFRSLQSAGRPFVTHKVATTLDGHIACEGGDSRWITGEKARRCVHRLRAESDAVIVGVGTVIADDPDLTVRTVPLPSGKQPRAVVFDRTLRIPISAKVARPGTVVITTTDAAPAQKKALEDVGCHILAVDADVYSIGNILPWLADLGMGIVLLESGGTLASEFYRSRCVDEVQWFIAPKVVGGGKAPVGLSGPPLATLMNSAIELTQMQVHRYGVDVRITGRPVWEGREAAN